MTMTEADRLFMYEGFRECMTEKVADLLMEHLPPTGWADVARVQDLNQLEKNTDIQFVSVRSQIANLENVMNAKFESVSNRLENLEEMMNTKFEAVEHRCENLEKRMNAKFESVDTRFVNLTQMLNVQFSHIDGRLNRMFQALLTFAGITATGFGVIVGLILTQH